MSRNAIEGVIAPNLTPFDADFSVVEDLYVRHAKWLLAEGCGGLAPFGTTGEALSVGIAERKRMLERLVQGGIDPSLLIPGTGLCSLADTADLTRHAMELGCRGAMTLPPFFYKGVSDDGLFDYFDRLIGTIADTRLRLYLYHIPPVAQVGFSLPLVERLVKAFGETIAGIKDSSGDWENTRALISGFPGLAVYPGSEMNLIEAARLGSPGCITATANVNAAAIRKAYVSRAAPDGGALQDSVRRYRQTIQPHGPIPAMKAMLAVSSDDERWRTVAPPLLPMGKDAVAKLTAALAELA